MSAILWDDGCMVQTLLDQGYEVTTVGTTAQLLLSHSHHYLLQPFVSLASSPMGDTARGKQHPPTLPLITLTKPAPTLSCLTSLLSGSHPLHFASLCLSANSIVVLLRAGAPTEAVCPEVFIGPDRGRSALTNCKVSRQL